MLRRRLTAFLMFALAIAVAVIWNVRKGDGATRSARTTRTAPVRALDSPPVQVLVTKLQPTPGEFVFRYTVMNGSAFPITDVEIGRDYYQGVVQLNFAPKGWDGNTVPTSSYRSPPGWNFQLDAAEDDTVACLHWFSDRPGEAIMGGASAAGFEITVPTYDAPYEHGFWTVLLDSADEPTYSNLLQSTGVTEVPVSSMFAKSDLRISPNPGGGLISISFAMPTAGKVTVEIFDVSGRRVRRVIEEQRPVGGASTSWDGKDDSGKPAASGVYFVRVRTPSTQRFGRVTWMRATK
jgi:hypothetical protein